MKDSRIHLLTLYITEILPWLEAAEVELPALGVCWLVVGAAVVAVPVGDAPVDAPVVDDPAVGVPVVGALVVSVPVVGASVEAPVVLVGVAVVGVADVAADNLQLLHEVEHNSSNYHGQR